MRGWALFVDDDFTLHTHVTKTAKLAALERVRSRSVSHEFDGECLSLGDRPAILRGGKGQSRRSLRVSAIRIDVNLEPVLMIQCRDFQLHLRSLLDVH